jgi:predicted AAA+ superfamily ATPase
LIETWVVLEILRQVQRWAAKPSLYHFRSRGGAEVDLILEINGSLYPIEVKSTSHPRARDASGARALRDAFPRERIQPALLVCAIDMPQWIADHVLALPWWML